CFATFRAFRLLRATSPKSSSACLQRSEASRVHPRMSGDPCRPQAQGDRWPPAPEVFVPAFAAVAGCAMPTGSAGHAGATANLKLTFHLDHSAGADHLLK